MDLLQSQIKKSCSLALPEGLKDLMSDISREVLRAQPNDIPRFIADYLEVLLEVRENLCVACHVANETCEYICEPDFYNEFKALGFSEEHIDIATRFIEKHFDKKNVREQSLLIKLAKKISTDEVQLSSIRDAIQKVFKRHLIKDSVLSERDDRDEEVIDGLHHTLDRYKQNKLATEEVFFAPNFEPCESTVSSDPASYNKIPKYIEHPADERSAKDTVCTSLDYAINSTSTGRVKFVDKKVLLKRVSSDKEKTKTANGKIECGDEKNIDEDEEDCEADDNNEIYDEAALTDNDVEENIECDSLVDISSSVDEDLAADPEYGSSSN